MGTIRPLGWVPSDHSWGTTIMTQRDSSHLLERLAKLRESIQRKGGSDPSAAGKGTGHEVTGESRPTPPITRNDPTRPDEDKPDDRRGRPGQPEPEREREGSNPNRPQGPDPKGDVAIEGIMGRLQELAPGILRPEDAPAAASAGPSARPARNAMGAANSSAQNPASTPPLDAPPDLAFAPPEPASFREAGVNDSLVEELILKYLLTIGENTGHGIAEQLKLPFPLITDLIGRMKYDQVLQYRGTTALNDYVCSLTELGRERARRHAMRCTYFGSTPVTLIQYCDAIAKQSLRYQNPSEEDLRRAFADLLINPAMIARLGAAMNSGRGMFLYGFPGNGKTSIAERITRAFGEFIWIPRSIGVDGEIIRIFDPTQHEEAPLEGRGEIVRDHKIDQRWVRIRRPTIIVGGELTMSNLELSVNHATGINEAPVQLKSNCGTLVIDDFGRQRCSVSELLNRWIVPLEKRVDYLNLPSGKKVEVPFDQLVVFSTNLEPKDLVDDAFLRRIPYKINVDNPSEAEFRMLFEIVCGRMGLPANPEALDYLVETHYRPTDRAFRCCHPRDLLLQVQNYCRYLRRPAELCPETLDFAAQNYFSMM